MRGFSGTDRTAVGGDSYFPTLTKDQDGLEDAAYGKAWQTDRHQTARVSIKDKKDKMLDQLRDVARKDITDARDKG